MPAGTFPMLAMNAPYSEAYPHAIPEFAYVVEIEWGETKIGARENITPWALRVTMIFRPEDGT